MRSVRFATTTAASAAPAASSTRTAPLLMVSSPHPQSAIRLVRFNPVSKEMPQTQLYNRQRAAIQQMHHSFWAANNSHFEAQMAAFEQKVYERTGNQATHAEFARFYKSYLTENQQRHWEYNTKWWRANAELAVLALKSATASVTNAQPAAPVSLLPNTDSMVGSVVGLGRGLKTLVYVLIGMDPQSKRSAQGVSVR
ncbi:hypothetical protein CcCBS67573_g08955 [Chytriomyces confervae]|uniref:Uncharacterized protein n=1 Tax=Chytriomyces confervae TaxID=246404 RepID=A0A507ED59_9FUNG|nr:hypothetical protein CcCBS67573_g08955 [Chytriomyces confervae]